MPKNIFAGNFKKIFSVGLTAVLAVSGFFIFSSLALAVGGVTITPASAKKFKIVRREK